MSITPDPEMPAGSEVGNAGADVETLMPPPPLPQQAGENETEKGTKNPLRA
jgi:hypothetical protein